MDNLFVTPRTLGGFILSTAINATILFIFTAFVATAWKLFS